MVLIVHTTPQERRWYSHKFKKTGLRYLVAVSINHSDIVYIEGPFPHGVYNDIVVFWWGIIGWLDENERAEANDGYIGEAPKPIECHREKRWSRNRQKYRYPANPQKFDRRSPIGAFILIQ